MGSQYLRSDEMNRKYEEHKASLDPTAEQFQNRHDNPIREFSFWLLIDNWFPYDRVTSTHHLLIPKRVFPFGEKLTPEEFEELARIKEELAPHYDAMMENLPRNRSVPGHYHLHFVEYKQIEG